MRIGQDQEQSKITSLVFGGKLVLFGKPQGSVLNPLLYILYTAELSQSVTGDGLNLHTYADDC